MSEKNLIAKALTDTVLTRRSFLKWSAVLGGTAAMAGGVHYGLKAAEAAAQSSGEETLTVACYHNCGGRCILAAKVKDGAVTRLIPDPTEEDTLENPRAIPCLRGRSQIRRVYSAERLKYPMKRVGKRGEDKFERISWEEALDTIASEMKRIMDAYGPESMYFMYASGTQWTGPDGRNPGRRLMRLFGGYTDYYGSYSTACYGAALPYITAGGGNSANDVLNANLVVLFGENSVVTRAGGDNFGYYLVKAREKGARFILVDPIYNDTGIVTDADWYPIYPGTDVALIAALSHVMVKENLYDKEFMATHAAGFDEDTLPEGAPANSSWMAYIMGTGYDKVEKTPEWASKITGLPAHRIQHLAREMASVKPCAMFQGWGWQRRAYGEQPVRALPILAAMTGNFGISGGGPGLRPSGMSFKMGGVPVPENPVKTIISVFMWPDMITRGSEMTNGNRDKIRGGEKVNANMKFMWNHGGNTIINQHSDSNGTAKILEDESQLEFIVTLENVMTPSCRYSDILLPETTSFEVENIQTGEGGGDKGSHAWALFNHQVIEPLYEAKPVLWIAEQIADRLGIGDAWREGHTTRDDWMRDMVAVAKENYPDFPDLEAFKEMGVYKVSSPDPTIAFKDFRADPVANPLKTETGKIEIYSPALARWNEPEEIPAIPMYIPEWEGVEDPLRETYPLLMVGHHAVERSHSTFANVDYLLDAHKQAFWMNPLDAQARGIQSGDAIKVYNDRGVVHTIAFVTNRLRPGVTSLPQGAWFTPDANGVDTGGCVNVLTKYHPTPLAKGNPQHTNLVQVEKI